MKKLVRAYEPTPLDVNTAAALINMAAAWRERINGLEARIASLEADRVAERGP